MKQIGEPKRVTANDAWGHTVRTTHTVFEIEESDVGRFRDHYLGYCHRRAGFGHEHVGKTITVYTDGTGWTCWTFN